MVVGGRWLVVGSAMTHYVCTGGCNGESGTLGVCQAEDCKKEGEPLIECNCEDGTHEEAEKEEEEEEA